MLMKHSRGKEMAEDHEHVDCQPDQRKWLERRPNEAATMEPHVYCVACGMVKNLYGPRARKAGFYLTGLSALKGYLQRSVVHGKMTQGQSRLIAKALEELVDFQDFYGLSLESQSQLYLAAVKRVRPDLDKELVLRLLPKVRRRSRRPLIEAMAKPSVC